MAIENIHSNRLLSRSFKRNINNDRLIKVPAQVCADFDDFELDHSFVPFDFLVHRSVYDSDDADFQRTYFQRS